MRLSSLKEYKQERHISTWRVHLRKPFGVLAQHWFGWRMRTKLWALAGVQISTAYVGRECFFDQEFPELIIIEDAVTLSTRVTVIAHDSQRGIVGGVIVRRFAFVGAGAIILPGVEIGEGAIVGAGAIVTKSVPAGMTVVGNPAKPITAASANKE